MDNHHCEIHDPAVGAISEAVAAAEEVIYESFQNVDDLHFNDEDESSDRGSFVDDDDWSLDDEVDNLDALAMDLANELRAAEEIDWDKRDGALGVSGTGNDSAPFEGNGRRARARRARIKRELMARDAVKKGEVVQVPAAAPSSSSLVKGASPLSLAKAAASSSSFSKAVASPSSLAKAAAPSSQSRDSKDKPSPRQSGGQERRNDRSATNKNRNNKSAKHSDEKQRSGQRQRESSDQQEGGKRYTKTYEHRSNRRSYKERTPTKSIQIGNDQSQTVMAPLVASKPFEGKGRRARARRAKLRREGMEAGERRESTGANEQPIADRSR